MIGKLSAALAALIVALAPAAHADSRNGAIHPPIYVVRDADSTMFLFGTVHVRRPGSPWGGPEAQAALAAADEVWTEVIITPEGEAAAQALALQLGQAPAGEGLSTHLTPAQNQRLQALLQRLGIPAALIEPYRPWFAAITLSIVPLIQSGYDPMSGVDRAVDAVGDASGKQMSAFESVEQQMAFLSGFTEEQQIEMLLDAIDEAEKGAAELDQMIAAWEQGDLSGLERLAIDEMRRDYPELYDVLLVRRNRAWIDVMVAELNESGVDFIAVGAAHLLGEDGLVALLEARGYTVERISPAT